MHHESRDEYPRPVVVRIREEELERIVDLDIDDSGGELEQRAPHEQSQAQALERVGE